VTIPGRGDLSPPHRHVPVGRYVTVVLVVALLAGGGYAAYRGLSGGSGGPSAASLPRCAKSAAVHHPRAAALPQSKVAVYNASLITGLAAQVGADLGHRGFPIGHIGNASKVGTGVATVRYSADRKVEATRLAAQIKGATLVAVGGQHVVELELNPKFTAMVSKRAGAAAFRAAAVSQHLVTSGPTPAPTCRSHP
jgi:hypothetical protein